ncbi:FAD-dependent monooxygenase [Streptomyces sp. NPDC101160]|uniref:FAD-dependent monooxygenase n=1 Tax=Streptomyces sp. NPDC101160 TaxID=3366118 RepID=UPI00382D5533
MRNDRDTVRGTLRGSSGPALDVLVVGAGPVGLTAAAELRRHGTAVRIVDRLPARLPYAKAVGVQPRTLELWDRMGCVRAALEAAVPLRGQLAYVDGVEQPRLELTLPGDVPYRFAALPQYETERILEEFLARFGTRIERDTELVGFEQDEDGVTARLVRAADGAAAGGGPPVEEEVRCRYLVGCDGAHSAVRKGLGLAFEGGSFPEEFMLGDVEVDWDLPPGYAVRSTRRGAAGRPDEVLVGIPLPGRRRYRMSMTVPPELSASRRAELATAGGTERMTDAVADEVTHGLDSGDGAPSLSDIQTVLDRLSPRRVTASALRWSSVFRISHRLVDRYGAGRVFVAGDAAHIHPPTGAQGMNTGIQDACNLAWKLSLAAAGSAAPGLLASYDAERRPVGAEVVGRTVRHSKEGVQADPEAPATLLLREAQLLVGYRNSPIVAAAEPGPDADRDQGADRGADRGPGPGPGGDGAGPRPGDRAPDCTGLTEPLASYPLRLYDLLRDRGHVLLLYGGDGPDWADEVAELAERAAELSGGAVRACAVVPGDATADEGFGVPAVPVYRDARGEFARQYAVRTPTAFLVRPDGYLGARLRPSATASLEAYLTGIFRV